ncbi:uncharacterized protein G2W53_032230 [Senna tora]|uniref:Uncharacterized protein n=1 Tax=Senna tora TaxID=362788 RepID=A0A834SWC2_9FABA|nr:uncharacterized protein G2W53_032230 [Senna tora]
MDVWLRLSSTLSTESCDARPRSVLQRDLHFYSIFQHKMETLFFLSSELTSMMKAMRVSVRESAKVRRVKWTVLTNSAKMSPILPKKKESDSKVEYKEAKIGAIPKNSIFNVQYLNQTIEFIGICAILCPIPILW